MIVGVKHRCNDFDSYRAARVKSLFNAESGCNWEHTAELPIEGMEWKIGLIVGPSGSGRLFSVDLAIAPLLTTKIPDSELQSPRLGTLIFHPSPLPYGRGASAIRWAYRRKEPITAATWFWATDELDAGDICEQEIVKIDYNLRPREFYEKHIIPAMCRTLERCLTDIEKGFKRQIKQVEEYATYDGRIE